MNNLLSGNFKIRLGILTFFIVKKKELLGEQYFLPVETCLAGLGFPTPDGSDLKLAQLGRITLGIE